MNIRPLPLLLTLLLAALLYLFERAAGAFAAPTGEPAPSFPVVFFPPDPPVYGARIPDRPATTRWMFYGRRLVPPEGLAEYVGDFIYPPLSTRLYSAKFSRSLEARLDRYRNRRNTLLNALLEQCLLLQDADDAARAEGFRAFAAIQTPSIAALENEAEELRQALTRDGLLTTIDWNTPRRWKLDSFPPNKEWANLEGEFQVVRAAAYYQDGLIPPQRGLLRELAQELAVPARKARGEALGQTDSDALYFSPETSRLRLPPNLPPEALQRLARFNFLKDTLKRQLREAIHQQDRNERSDGAAVFARLAEEQWPQLSDLETLAEEIRRDLAPRFVPAAPAKPSAIPNWLLEIINAYNDDRDTYYGELREAIRRAVEQVPRPLRIYDPDEQLRQEQEYLKQRNEAQRLAIVEFQLKNAERLAELEKRSTAIRSALDAIARTIIDPKTKRPFSVDKLLQQHVATMDAFEGFGRATAIYTHYRTAVLQPGLSPEQRRLLFAYAVAGLAQPLPHGEPLPARAAKYPLPR